MNLQWDDVYKVVYKGDGRYGIYYKDSNRTVNFALYCRYGTAIGVAKRMFNQDMKKVEQMLTSEEE